MRFTLLINEKILFKKKREKKAMTDLDDETLEKFRKLQMMLAESPEIVEALNSPELLALAAFASSEKNKNQALPPTQ